MFKSRAGEIKWEQLKEKGYYRFHTRTAGYVFGTKERGEEGFIDWWGRVTWKRGG